MKITIEAEDDKERGQLAEPWVREGVTCCGLSGVSAAVPDPADGVSRAEFAFLHGGLVQVKVHMTRCLIELEPMIQRQIGIEAGVQVHNMLIEAQQRNAIIQDVAKNGRGLRIARP